MKLCDGEANGGVNRKRNEEANGVGSHVESHEGCLVNLQKVQNKNQKSTPLPPLISHILHFLKIR